MEKDGSPEWSQDWHSHLFRGWHGLQAKRGDMSPIVLKLLAERPMHGYEIIRELEHRSHGMWRPSPGSIYPTLQLLEEQDLVTSQEQQGKRVYTITDAGRIEAQKMKPRGPWGHGQSNTDFGRIMEARGIFMSVASSFRQILRQGSAPAQEEALTVLKQAEQKLHRLADDCGASTSTRPQQP